MDASIAKQLVDKMYEKRKAAALDLEKQIRECHLQGDQRRISQIVDQLVEMLSNVSNPLHVRNGGLIGLAGTAIALGVDVAPYMDKFVEPLLVCFTDPENRVRYFSAECLYNIAKVSKGEILVWFNPIFDALSKLAADSELSVKNGAELLDRLLKDIVAECASVYIPQYAETEKAREKADEAYGQSILVPHPDDMANGADYQGARKAFSLAHFIPLLSDRIYVVSPFTRSFLVSWITVLNSVPELELITYLPEFFDGLLKYLSDPLEDVRAATENILADFLREMRDVTAVRKREEEDHKSRRSTQSAGKSLAQSAELVSYTEQSVFAEDGETDLAEHAGEMPRREEPEKYERETGAWVPGQGVQINYAAIVEILLEQLNGQHDEIQESTALRWLAELLSFVQELMIPFTPRLLIAILPNLAHHVSMIQTAALRTNKLLTSVVQSLPDPPPAERDRSGSASIRTATSPPPTATSAASRQGTKESALKRDQSMESLAEESSGTLADRTPTPSTFLQKPPPPRAPTLPATSTQPETGTGSGTASATGDGPPRSQSPVSSAGPSVNGFVTQQQQLTGLPEEPDPFDYQATVNALTIQFYSEHEETRVAALKWLIMLHQKAPKKILAMDDGTFPALLKTLSDSSEEVIKQDLQLIAQISSSSEEGYFKTFMINLVELFSTDRKLLDTRGSLIIRQLCLNLNTERIYKAFADILEKEEDLDFASGIVQKLNMILITSPELADFRRRLKSLEFRQDGQALFTGLYKSWCHNAVATFSLCLLAQAYEHASNLLYIFADLEITVPLLVQVDKLVQLIESPVFTYLRLQLLEPEKYPYLFKCLYGLLMLLPQSSAFVSLRNRLNAVNSAGFLHISPKPSGPSVSSTRSKISREDIKWQELLSHFRSVQIRHEKARRQVLGAEITPFTDFMEDRFATNSTTSGRPPVRRRVTGGTSAEKPAAIREEQGQTSKPGVLSPLNPRAKGNGHGLLASALASRVGARATSPTTSDQKTAGGRRTLSLVRKP